MGAEAKGEAAEEGVEVEAGAGEGEGVGGGERVAAGGGGVREEVKVVGTARGRVAARDRVMVASRALAMVAMVAEDER
jgi:head-tail adaptor